jgi:hypothetical protein
MADWCEERDVGRTSLLCGCDRLKVQTCGEPGQHWPQARNVPLQGDGMLIPAMLMIGITAPFRSRFRSFEGGGRPKESQRFPHHGICEYI